MPRILPPLSLAVLVFPLLLAACGDTWQGAKKDTRENVQAVGKGVEKAGEKIQQVTE
ncbi:hypothetical protein HRbin40_00743 [bacterium HR40]|nr:hypothetical protein HRbin40_00743 [bacterium HR40]